VKIFRATLFSGQLYFQGKRKLLKNPECKGIFNTVKNFRATLFSGQAQSCSKILNGEKYIQQSEKFQGNSVFQCNRKLLKHPER